VLVPLRASLLKLLDKRSAFRLPAGDAGQPESKA
jgi:hypothetical protein